MVYKFRMDGRDHATGMGDTAAWTVLDSNTWQTIWKSRDKILSTETLRLGPDGKTLTVTNSGTKPNGERIKDSSVFQRQQGGPGLAGRWKSTAVKSDSGSVIEFGPLAKMASRSDSPLGAFCARPNWTEGIIPALDRSDPAGRLP
jgi:hypothetical protein